MSRDLVVHEGYVKRIRYRKAETGFTILVLETKYGDYTCLGVFAVISEGAYISVTGTEEDNEEYQETQIRVVSYEEKNPDDIVGMERYLGSGMIKGIGEALAKRIVKKFKLDTFRVIEEEPERLAEVKGISERKARDIATQFIEMKDMRDAMVFLGKYNIPSHQAVKIYNEYGDNLYQILEANPYRLAEDISGFGFKTADEIAMKMGIDPDSQYRLNSGIVYVLERASLDGNVYLPEQELISKSAELLEVRDANLIASNVLNLIISGKLILKRVGDEKRVYTPTFAYSEEKVARKVLELDRAFEHYRLPDEEMQEYSLRKIEDKLGVTFDDLQREAILETVKHGVTIITGGPGTGKTTIINAIIKYFEMEGSEMLLAAPTGRAAKRMKEATGYEASTIHRLLEITGDPGSDMHFKFEKNHESPLEADVVIIDETSMVDIFLMNSLTDAVAEGTRLILVGDVNQLPSVGPGNVLKDLIGSGEIATVRLNRVYRQDEKSRIVENAHKINRGEQIPIDNESKDFFFIPKNNPKDVIDNMISLITTRLPGYTGVSPMEIQVLSPQRRGDTGIENLNIYLQNVLNPETDGKNEHVSGKVTFREGDKVMQIKNNYKLQWSMYSPDGNETDTGLGVFNGDVGVITKISDFAEEVTVEFDEGHVINYPFGILDELELAYAITIHKSQGSEYPVVIIPILSGPPMLYTRNLLYTAVTRAKQLVALVGSTGMISRMISNNMETKRYSGLKEAIYQAKEDMSGDK